MTALVVGIVSDVILFEDDELGEVVHNVERDGASDEATLTLVEGGTGSTVPVEDVSEYEIRFDYLRDALRDLLKPMGLKGRVRELADHLHQLGVATIGLAEAPIYLARATSVDKVLEASDRLVRGEAMSSSGAASRPRTADLAPRS